MVMCVFQRLDLNDNGLHDLPIELSSLGNLRELLMHKNYFTEAPISVLRHLTALNTIDMSASVNAFTGRVGFQVPSSLLPILHPGLVTLDLRYNRIWQVPFDQNPIPHKWDPTSWFHLGRAVVEVSSRVPRPAVLFRD